GQGDVIHRHVDASGGAPVLGVFVEPHVVGGDEVTPLQNLERLLRAPDPDRGAESDRRGRSGRRGHEFTSIDPLPLCHGSLLKYTCGTTRAAERERSAASAVHGGRTSLRGADAARRHGGTAGATRGRGI